MKGTSQQNLMRHYLFQYLAHPPWKNAGLRPSKPRRIVTNELASVANLPQPTVPGDGCWSLCRVFVKTSISPNRMTIAKAIIP